MPALYRRSITADVRTISLSAQPADPKSCRKFVPIRVHSWLRLPDYVLYIDMGRMIPVRPRHQSDFDRTNFLHRLLRAGILFPDKEHDALNKLERVIEQ